MDTTLQSFMNAKLDYMTTRPPRQIALSDKTPSNTSAIFYETEERAICLQLGQIALLCRQDKSPSGF